MTTNTNIHARIHTHTCSVHNPCEPCFFTATHQSDAVLLATPLLMPKWLCHKDGDQVATLMDHTGGLVTLPSDLRVCQHRQ